MKIFRLACLALALTPLSLGMAGILSSTPVLAAPAVPPIPPNLLPPGAPPFTKAQKLQYQARMGRFEHDMQALQDNTALSQAQKQQQYNSMIASLNKDMQNILTPKQRAAVEAQNNKVLSLKKLFYQENKADIVKQQQLTLALRKSMTPAQQQKIQAIKDGAQAQIDSVRANAKMAPDVKNKTIQGIVGNATRQGMAVLNPTQQSEIKQLRALTLKLNAALVAFAKAHHQP